MLVELYTNKSWGEWVTCSHGVIDDAALEAFHYGYCHVLALELHKATGWPLIAIWYHGNTHDDDFVPEHVAVKHPEGWIVDIYGAYDFDSDPGDFIISDHRLIDSDTIDEYIDSGYKPLTEEATSLAASLVPEILIEVEEFLSNPQVQLEAS